MSKGLEALKWLIDNGYVKYENSWQESPYILESINTIEKELKALVIIKKLFEANALGILKTNDNKYFLRVFDRAYEIDKEEYELLKEVLK